MKYLVQFILVIAFTSSELIAQDITAKVYLITGRITHSALIDDGLSIDSLLQMEKHKDWIVKLDYHSVRINTEGSKKMLGENDDYIYINFEDSEGNLVTLSDAEFRDVSIHNYKIKTKPSILALQDKFYYTFELKFDGNEPSDQEKLILETSYSSQNSEFVEFRYWNSFELYNTLGLGRIGLWVPTNIYSLDFSGNKVLAQVAPVGIAFGGKINFRALDTGFQLGFSLAASYTVARSQTDNLSIGDISVGSLVQINDYLTFGLLVPTKWISEESRNKPYFVIGIAPNLQKILGGSSK